MKTNCFIVALVVLLLSSSVYVSFQPVHAQNGQLTLAETINNVVSNIQNWYSPFAVLYGQIFGVTNQSSYDLAILQALNQSDYTDVIFMATLAQLNGYSSTIINDSVTTALENIPMCGSLPVTTYSDNETDSSYPAEAFCVYDRYMINAYQDAQELGVSGWNITQAFLDFANAYLQMPINSVNGEMLWIDPALDFSASYTSRYYDEYAETLDVFLMFAEAGVSATVTYNGQTLSPINFADDMWLNVQNLWNGKFYNYYGDDKIIECELGNFAQIISEYQNYRGNIPYFNRVIQDLEYALLAENFSSPLWSTAGVLEHAFQMNPEQRLEETTGAIIALQMLYPDFNSTMQSNFESMLKDGMWQGLIASQLFNNSQFQFTSNPTSETNSGSGFSDDASSIGAMTLFLDGIVPDTGYLAIKASNEAYQDYRTCFPTSEWNFNYQNQTITIPVTAGTLSFLFGTQEVTQNFPSNGVYEIQFAPDWNSITSMTQIATINNVTLQSVMLQAIQRPNLTPTPTPTSASTPAPASSTPAPASSTATPKPTLLPKNGSFFEIPLELIYYAVGAVVIGVTVTALVFLRKSRNKLAPSLSPPHPT